MSNVKATYSLCGDMGIEILDVEHGIEDKIVWRYTTSPRIHTTKIHHGGNGRSFFRAGPHNIHLDECIRTGQGVL